MTNIPKALSTRTATPTWMRMAPRSAARRRRTGCVCVTFMAVSASRSVALLRGRRVDDTAAALELFTDVVARREEARGKRRHRRHFVRVQRTHEARRHDDEQLRALLAVRFRLEQVADDRQAAENRQCG